MVDWHGKEITSEEPKKFSEMSESEKKEVLNPFSTILQEIKNKIQDNPKAFLEEKKHWRDSWYPQVKDPKELQRINRDWQNQVLYSISLLDQGQTSSWRTDKMLKVMETKDPQEVEFMKRLAEMHGGSL